MKVLTILKKITNRFFTKDLESANASDDFLLKVRGYKKFMVASQRGTSLFPQIRDLTEIAFKYFHSISDQFKVTTDSDELPQAFLDTLHNKEFTNYTIHTWFEFILKDIIVFKRAYYHFDYQKDRKFYLPRNLIRLSPETIFKIGNKYIQIFNLFNLLKPYPSNYRIRIFDKSEILKFTLPKNLINVSAAFNSAESFNRLFELVHRKMSSEQNPNDLRIKTQISKFKDFDKEYYKRDINKYKTDMYMKTADTLFLYDFTEQYRIYTMIRYLKCLTILRNNLISEFNKQIAPTITKLNNISQFNLKIKDNIYPTEEELDKLWGDFESQKISFDEALRKITNYLFSKSEI